MKRLIAVLLALFASNGIAADERRADATLRLGFADYHAVDASDVSFGVGLSYRLSSWLAADATFGFAPKDLGDPSFSGSRTEGGLGVRLGPHLDRSGVYVAARPGFVEFGEPEEPIACIRIFPPPLRCQLADGRSLFAMDLAGGLQLTNERGLLRVEVADRLLKYPSPSIDPDGELRQDGFWSHNLAASVAVGVRF